MRSAVLRRRSFFVAFALVAFGWIALPGGSGARAVADAPWTRIADGEFWKLVEGLSERDGTFRSDNLLSNEMQFQYVIPELLRTARAGRAYLGVGPEQNFTYIAALRPAIAFIVDIRRGNLDLHLLYKALFELTADRAEFVSSLFSRPKPAALGSRSSVAEIFDAYASVGGSERLYTETLATVRNHLVTTRGFRLAEGDLLGIEYVFRAFFVFGPKIQYSPIGLGGATVQPTYAELMAATDNRGQARGFLASEEAFAFVKGLESRNLVVPVVGDFAGPRALRAVGAYLKQRGSAVSAFYVSNVEEYLRRDGIWQDFCDNVSALPVDDTSLFIRSVRPGAGIPADGLTSELGPIAQISNCR